MRYKDISTADLLVMSSFRALMVVFSVALLNVGMKGWCSKSDDSPLGGIAFVSIIFVGSVYDIIRLVIDYTRQEMGD